MTGEDVRIVALDAKAWRTAEDFRTALLTAIGAPAGAVPVDAVTRTAPPLRIEIASLHAAGEAAMEAVYEDFGALTLAGAKTRIGKDGVASIELKSPA